MPISQEIRGQRRGGLAGVASGHTLRSLLNACPAFTATVLAGAADHGRNIAPG
ncbi:hypothetical protein ACRAWG_08130 [Methylobacterium sp. P31]